MAEDGSGGSPSGGAVLAGVTPRAYLGVLSRKPFRNLTLATLTSAMGDWIGFLAIIALTESILGPTRAAAFAVSGVMAARVLPSLLLGPVAGVFVDRWDRKRVLIWTDIGRGAVMALIPFTDEVLTLVLATLVIELLSALFAPAKDAVFPTLVERSELVIANQINLITTYGTLPLGALVYAGFGALATTIAEPGSFLAGRPMALAIWFNALSFWISAPLLARIEIPRSVRLGTHADSADPPGAFEQLKEGFRFIAGHPVIRALILGVMIAFASAGVVISVGEFFAGVLNTGPSGYGILVAVVGTGLLAGLFLSAPLTQRVADERLFAPGIGLAGVALIVTALMPTLLTAVVPAFIMGMGAGVSFIVGYTVLQKRSDDAIRGRTFAAFNSGVRTAIFGSTIAVPSVIGVLGRETPGADYAIGGVRISLLLAGGLSVLGAVLAGRALHRALVSVDGTAGELGLAGETTAPVVTRRGVFVAFEGGDGAGKSTQIRLLRSAVERAGWPVLVTREPGGTPIGEGIRKVLLSRESDRLSDRSEALLYAAARAQHVDEVIVPALEAGTVVLCDRYVDSSVAYQGAARGLGEDAVAELNSWATGGLRPDLVVLLDVDAEEGLRRVGGHAEPDRLEAAGLDFHRAVAAAYRRRAEDDPDHYLVVDATLPVEDLHGRIAEVVLAAKLRERDGTSERPAGSTADGHADGTAELPIEDLGEAEETATIDTSPHQRTRR